MRLGLLRSSLIAAAAVASSATLVFACGEKTKDARNTAQATIYPSATASSHCAPGQTKASATTFTAASAEKKSYHAGCASKGTANTTAIATGARSVDAVLAGSGAHCGGKGAARVAGKYSHIDCDACADMALCEDELKTLGSHSQIVPLKNGVMFVYTADAPNGVQAVQAAVTRRTERMSMLASAEKAKLCPECKSIRGAIASGKLNREVVNIEGGCLTLMTSNDPAMVGKIYHMAGLQSPARIKS